MNTSLKSHLRKARKERQNELKQLFKEVKSFSFLNENKNLPAYKKKTNYFISEYNRIAGAYTALLMLEFYEQGTKQALGALFDISNHNKDNEIGQFLRILLPRVQKIVKDIDEINKEETEATEAAGGYKAKEENTTHPGYGSGGGVSVTPGGGIRESLSEKDMMNELFGFGKKPAAEPYQPTGNVARDLQGNVVGTYGPAELTDKGKRKELTKKREQLMGQYQKEMPKVVAFIDAYLAVFREENKQLLKNTKKGFFGGSPVASLIQKEFGKLGNNFNVKIFMQEMSKNPAIVDENIRLAEKQWRNKLTQLEDVLAKQSSRNVMSFGKALGSMFQGMAGSGKQRTASTGVPVGNYPEPT